MATFASARSQFLLLALLMAAGAAFYRLFPLNHDTSWYLVSTRMFLDGGRLYADIMEVNPPLAFYLTVPAIWLSDALRISPSEAFVYYVILVASFCSLWTIRLTDRAGLSPMGKAIFFGAAIVAGLVLPISEFGQREHLLLILGLPFTSYLVLRERLSALSGLEKASLGMVASLGFALKPHFLLIPAGILLFRFAHQRRFSELVDPANLMMAASLIAYALFVVTFHPLYLGDIVPAALEVYGSYGRSAANVLLRPELAALLFLSPVLFIRRHSIDCTGAALVGAAVGSATSYLIQFKGWNYQAFPLAFFTSFAVAWLTYSQWEAVRRNVALGALLLLSLLFSLGNQVSRPPYRPQTTDLFRPFISRPAERILVLSTNVWASFPFVNDVEGRWSSRYPAQWLLPGAITRLTESRCEQQPSSCAEPAAIVQRVRSDIIADLDRYQPDIVFVDDRANKPYFEGLRFDYIEFLSDHPQFAAEWEPFARVGRAGDYTVWRRVAAASTVAP